MNSTKQEWVNEYIGLLNQAIDKMPVDQIVRAAEMIHSARLEQKMIFTMGNGGSSATASHMACDFSKNTRVPYLPAIRTMCLSDSTPTLTAFANDEGYEKVFSEPLKALAEPGDILIAISGSGNSANILRGLETAREIGLKTIGLSGFKGGKMISMVDLPINIDTDSIERVEDLHMVCDHLLTMVLREIAMHEPEGKR